MDQTLQPPVSTSNDASSTPPVVPPVTTPIQPQPIDSSSAPTQNMNAADISSSDIQAGALVQPMVQAVGNATPSPISVGSAKSKEAGPGASMEITPTIEMVGSDAIENEPLPPEVSSWMEKVNRDNSGEKPPEVVVADKTANDPSGSYSSQPVFVLPLGDAEYKTGLHTSVNESVRWLAEWCRRLVKKMGNQVTMSGE